MNSSDTDRFETSLETRLREAIARGVRSYTALLSELGDVYPSVMLAALRRLAAAGDLDSVAVERIHANSRHPCPIGPVSTPSSHLPVPHPLDFDWRFTEQALERLRNESRVVDAARLICLGAPSLYWHLKERTTRTVHLLDANVASFNRYGGPAESNKRIQLDVLQSELPSIRAGAIVADPPWYSEHLRGFLWVARELCDEGGRVWISVPGVGTRPGIEQEIASLVTWANELGMRVAERSRGALPYRTPPFERNALRAEGIECVPTQWRRGDLLVFTVVADNACARPIACSLELAEWEEVRLDQVRVRFRIRGRTRAPHDLVDPRLRSIVPGDVLPSVSRRDPRRPLAQVWTSGNRVFGCDSPAIAYKVAESIIFGATVIKSIEHHLGRRLRAVEKACIEETDAQLRELREMEKLEYRDEWGIG